MQAEMVQSAAGAALVAALEGPSLTGEPSARTLEGTLRAWFSEGRTLGFERLSSGLLQLAQSMTLESVTDLSTFQDGLAAIQAATSKLLAATGSASMRASQFSEEYEFRYGSGEESVSLRVNAQGRVSLVAMN
jgi:hypothetical protein